MYVCRTLDKTVAEPSMLCLITPTPSLLAEPSRPIARYGRSGFFNGHDFRALPGIG